MRIRSLLFSSIFIVIASQPASISLASEKNPGVPVDCDPYPGYHLCQSRVTGEEFDHEWSITGDLAINLASGPMASIRCESGQSGEVRVRIIGRERRSTACVRITCGSDTVSGCAQEAEKQSEALD